MSNPRKYQKILIANRGEIAVRVIRGCRELGISPVAVFSDADDTARHVQLADEAYGLGPAPASESYLDYPKILTAAKTANVQAIHPGYGFLSENEAFARACTEAGIDFIGPSPEAIQLMGSKIASKATMDQAGVPTIPGYYGDDQSDDKLMSEALKIGFPLLVKASAGGGGKGMRVVRAEKELAPALASARREALNAFGDDSIFLEKYFESVRHIEVQIMADHHGQTVHLFERECSIQRRHQKIIEEAPSIALDEPLRQSLTQAAVKAAEAVNYTNAGTVEMLLDSENKFYFLEMNTRLQVEHPVTELITGVDLVKTQIQVAQGHPLPFTQADLKRQGHAIEVRIYAEDPDRGFLPTTGQVKLLKEPQGPGIRLDSALFLGQEVTHYYDPILAKLVAWGTDRNQALARIIQALENYVLLGLRTNIPYLLRVLRHPAFEAGQLDTHFIERHTSDLQPPTELPLPVLAAICEAQSQARPSAVSQAAGQAEPASPWLTLGHWRN